MSVIANIQQQVADALAANPFFAHITIHTEAVGRILDAFEKAMSAELSVGGKVGAFVLVMSPDANANWPEVNKPFFDNIKIHVQVTVNTELAADAMVGVGVTDLDICEAVCNTLHQIFLTGANAPLVCDAPTITLMDKGEDGTSTRLCRFKTMGGIRTLPGQLETPVIGLDTNAHTFNFSFTTPGVAIFYTLDGSNPMPLHGTYYPVGDDVPYTPGQLIKARSWLAGYLASDTATQPT